MGLQWEDFLGKCSSKLLRLFGLHWASKGVKWCKSEGVKDKLTPHSYIFFGLPRGLKWCKSEGLKDKLTPHSYIFFGLPRGVKWCKSEGVKDKITPHSYIFFGLPRGVKRCKSWGVTCLLPLHSYTILPPLEAQCSPKRRKSFELHFPKKSSPCSPTLASFYPLGSPTLASFYPPPPWQPNSYIILPPISYIVLAPIPEDCQS